MFSGYIHDFNVASKVDDARLIPLNNNNNNDNNNNNNNNN